MTRKQQRGRWTKGPPSKSGWHWTLYPNEKPAVRWITKYWSQGADLRWSIPLTPPPAPAPTKKRKMK